MRPFHLAPAPELERDEILHYSRHLIIPEVGVSGQRRLKGARILLIGAGGLGSPAAQYLAAAGVGTIGIVDFDIVDASNLQRQVLYTTADVGRAKLEAAAARLQAMNPMINVVQHAVRLDAENALEIVGGYDLVVDGTDNFATRYLVNDACVLLGKPNVYASVFRFEGLLSVFALDGGPCYRCLYPEPPPPGFAPSCAEGGVFGVLPGIMGTLQAAEAIKLITGVGRSMRGRLLRLDAAAMEFREFEVARDPACPLCGDRPTQTALVDYDAFCSGPAATEKVEAPAGVSPEWLRSALETGADIQLIDVRGANEFEIVRIEGARLLPLDELEDRADELDRSTRIVCYCKTGLRSARAVGLLTERGFGDVASLEGGIVAWAETVDASAKIY
jgi:sulfur-carrier protein adenylyltransferase/sulfurtransferase